MRQLVILVSFLILSVNSFGASKEEETIKEFYRCWNNWEFKKLTSYYHPELYEALEKYTDITKENYHKKFEDGVKNYKNVKEYQKENTLIAKDFEIAHKEHDISIVYFILEGKQAGKDFKVKKVIVLKEDGKRLKITHDSLYENSDYRLEKIKDKIKDKE